MSPDPGPEAVDKILDGLEEFKWSPTDVARQARRLRAHIATLRGQCSDANRAFCSEAGRPGTSPTISEISSEWGAKEEEK